MDGDEAVWTGLVAYSQAEGRGFESRFPLQNKINISSSYRVKPWTLTKTLTKSDGEAWGFLLFRDVDCHPAA